jgi:actin-related protein
VFDEGSSRFPSYVFDLQAREVELIRFILPCSTCSTLLYSTLLYSTLLHSTALYPTTTLSTPLHSTPDPQLPMDLRRTMARNIVIVGGISSIPGFLDRFEDELVGLIDLHSDREGKDSGTRDDATATQTGGTETGTRNHRHRIDRGKRAHERPFACLAGLRGDIRVVNAPRYLSGNADGSGSGDGDDRPGDAGVGWNGALVSWIGGSIAG